MISYKEGSRAAPVTISPGRDEPKVSLSVRDGNEGRFKCHTRHLPCCSATRRHRGCGFPRERKIDIIDAEYR